MNDVAVIDSSVLVEWYAETATDTDSLALHDAYVGGQFAVVAHRLLFYEVMNVAGRAWHWSDGRVYDLAQALGDLEFDVREPSLAATAQWVERGLTAYDASFVALAESVRAPLLTRDAKLMSLAGDIAITPRTFLS